MRNAPRTKVGVLGRSELLSLVADVDEERDVDGHEDDSAERAHEAQQRSKPIIS